MPNEPRAYQGLNFMTLRLALTALFWWRPGMEGDEWLKNTRYVLPMQHNWDNPIVAESGDTFIQYWINRDDRIVQDGQVKTEAVVLKEADVAVRFIGVQAEQWAKSLHHLSERKSVAQVFQDFCNAQVLEYVGPIIPIPIDYFKTKVGNAAIAFDVSFQVQYWERMDLSDLRKPLEYIAIASGTLISGDFPAGGE